MGLIRTLLSLALLFVIVVFGYWLYAAYSLTPDTPYWTEINRRMPDPLRRYACQQMRTHAGSGPIESCEGF